MIIRVYYHGNRSESKDVSVDSETTCGDVIAACCGAEWRSRPYYLTELCMGYERIVDYSEMMYEVLSQWRNHQDKVRFFLHGRIPSIPKCQGQSSGGQEERWNDNDGDGTLPPVTEVPPDILVGTEFSVERLMQMAARQKQKIKEQERMLANKSQHFDELQSRQQRQKDLTAERNERLTLLRERIKEKEAKLKKLKLLKMLVKDQENINTSLSKELESMRSNFDEKQEQLSAVISKMELIAKQLKEQRLSVDSADGSVSSARKEKLQNRVAECNRLNEQNMKLKNQKQELLLRRQKQVKDFEEKISKFRNRVLAYKQKKQFASDEKVNQSRLKNCDAQSNKAGGTSFEFMECDSKFQTLPHSLKFETTGSSETGAEVRVTKSDFTRQNRILEGPAVLVSSGKATAAVQQLDSRSETEQLSEAIRNSDIIDDFSLTQAKNLADVSKASVVVTEKRHIGDILMSHFAPRPYESKYSLAKSTAAPLLVPSDISSVADQGLMKGRMKTTAGSTVTGWSVSRCTTDSDEILINDPPAAISSPKVLQDFSSVILAPSPDVSSSGFHNGGSSSPSIPSRGIPSPAIASPGVSRSGIPRVGGHGSGRAPVTKSATVRSDTSTLRASSCQSGADESQLAASVVSFDSQHSGVSDSLSGGVSSHLPQPDVKSRSCATTDVRGAVGDAANSGFYRAGDSERVLAAEVQERLSRKIGVSSNSFDLSILTSGTAQNINSPPHRKAASFDEAQVQASTHLAGTQIPKLTENLPKKAGASAGERLTAVGSPKSLCKTLKSFGLLSTQKSKVDTSLAMKLPSADNSSSENRTSVSSPQLKPKLDLARPESGKVPSAVSEAPKPALQIRFPWSSKIKEMKSIKEKIAAQQLPPSSASKVEPDASMVASEATPNSTVTERLSRDLHSRRLSDSNSVKDATGAIDSTAKPGSLSADTPASHSKVGISGSAGNSTLEQLVPCYLPKPRALSPSGTEQPKQLENNPRSTDGKTLPLGENNRLDGKYSANPAIINSKGDLKGSHPSQIDQTVAEGMGLPDYERPIHKPIIPRPVRRRMSSGDVSEDYPDRISIPRVEVKANRKDVTRDSDPHNIRSPESSPKNSSAKQSESPETEAGSGVTEKKNSLSQPPFRRQGNLKRGEKPKLLRRVSFEPLALLLDASLEGELDLVEKTAREVPDVSAANDEGITALHNAICAGHFNVVRFLVEFGCDVNSPDSDGWTPLHCAASCNNHTMSQFLVDHGAAVFATTFSDQELASDKCEEDEDGYELCRQYLQDIEAQIGFLNESFVYAVFDYEAENPDELNFRSGDRLVVLRKGDDCEQEWWWSRVGDNEGYVPRNLVGLYPRVVPQWLRKIHHPAA